jgi:adenylate cyclase
MLESMSNGVITMDEEGTIVTCNAAGMRILQVEAKEILMTKAEEFFSGANAWVMERIEKILETQEAEIVMDVELCVDKEVLSVNLTVLPLVSTEEKRLGSMIMIEDISSNKRMKATMSRYMDPGIVDQLLQGDGDILDGSSTNATVLFSDIRGFSTITEELGAQGTVSFLNEYFTIMVECIQDEGGMLDKFIGDAIMAGFGIPVAHDDDEDRAVRAAVRMISEMWRWNEQRLAKGLMPCDMGIGINTDQVVSGNIGSPKRMDFTVIGDGVNVAARLESACKQYSARLLISENTVKKLRGTFRVRNIDDVVVKGKTKPVGVYEVLDFHTEETFPNAMEVVGHFKEGRNHYRGANWNKAIASFKECLNLNPEDKLSQTYIDRCQVLKKRKPKDWQGIWVMTSK